MFLINCRWLWQLKTTKAHQNTYYWQSLLQLMSSSDLVCFLASTGGSAARPGKVVGSVARYNNSDALEQRRAGRNNPVAAPTHYPLPASSYPKRSNSSSTCKNNKVETSIEVSSGNGPPYVPRKVAAAQGGLGSQWYWLPK